MEDPILSRVNRLDYILRQLGEFRSIGSYSPKSSSCASTRSSGSDAAGQAASSVDNSPELLNQVKHCRSIDEVMVEVEHKGSLIYRLKVAEERLMKVCLMLEEELHEAERATNSCAEKKSSKNVLKHLVKSCVGANVKHETKD